MGKPSPAQLELARRLLNRELRRMPDPEAAVARFCEQLLLHLSPLVGTAGVHALLARSVKLTRAEHPCLTQFIATSAQTPSTEEGRMSEQLREVLAQEPSKLTSDAAVALFAQLLSLLAALIGDRLTSQVIQEAWPEAPTDVKPGGWSDNNRTDN
jgi:hypothetical protein